MMNEVLAFLRELRENNNKEWFDENRGRYETCREYMYVLIERIMLDISSFDDEVTVTHPRESLFRIYRDVRFSPDKRPYKTHLGSYMARGGRKSIYAGYYVHIEPGASILAGGIWMPGSDVLRAIRTEINDNMSEFRGILADRGFARYYKKIEGEKLKTAPKGFDKNADGIELLQYKSYSFSTAVGDDMLLDDSLVDYAGKAFRALHPVNRFLNRAIDRWL